MDQTNQSNIKYNQQYPPSFPPQQSQAVTASGGGVEAERLAETDSALTSPEQKEEQPIPEQTPGAESDKSYLIRENKQIDDRTLQEETPEKVLGAKMSGYGVSASLANMKGKYRNMQGKGSIEKSSSWLIMLLDRILKKESLKSNSAS